MKRELYIVLLVGLIAGFLCVFFPPIRYRATHIADNVRYDSGEPAGRGCIITSSIHEVREGYNAGYGVARYYIDVQKLIFELVLVAFLTAIVAVGFKIRNILEVADESAD